MPKYQISYTETNYGSAVVEAEDAEAAAALVHPTYEGGNVYWNKTDLEYIVTEEV
jgi:hypothetical protein